MNKNLPKIKNYIVISFVFIISLFPAVSFAKTATLDTVRGNVQKNDNFYIDANIDQVSDLKSASIEVNYDQNLFDLINVEAGNPFRSGGCDPFISYSDEGIINISRYLCPSINIEENDTYHNIIRINLQAKEAGSANFDLVKLELKNSSDQLIENYDNNASLLISVSDTDDRIAPVITVNSPMTIIPSGTTVTELNISTDENSVCRFSTTEDTDYKFMDNQFITVDHLTHVYTLSDLGAGLVYNYFVKCQDIWGNESPDDIHVSFSVNTDSSISLSPNTITKVAGKNVSITLNTGNVSDLNMLETYISYDQNELEFVDMKINEDFDNPDDWMIISTLDSNPLQISIMSGGLSVIEGDKELLTLNFIAKNIGNSQVGFFEDLDGFFVNTAYNSELDILDYSWQPANIVIIPDVYAPIISDLNVSNIATSSAVIGWQTDENAIVQINYGKNQSNYDSQTEVYISSTTHQIALDGLEADTTYHYQVVATDSFGNVATSSDAYFKTKELPDVVAPSDITDLRMGAISTDSVTLLWTAPSDDRSSTTTEYDLRFSTSTISNDNFVSSSKVATNNPQASSSVETYIANSLNANTLYYFAVKSRDTSGNWSGISNVASTTTLNNPETTSSGSSGSGSSGGGGGGGGGLSYIAPSVSTASSTATSTNQNVTSTSTQQVIVKGIESETGGSDYGDIKSLAAVSSVIVEAVSNSEANEIYNNDSRVDLDGITLSLYEKIIKQSKVSLDQKTKYAIAYFIHYGTKTTKVLGAGERAGVLNSYFSVYGKLPVSIDDWKDVIKIANGRWPSVKNEQAEKNTQDKLFKKIYVRSANMINANDNAAVSVITYGLRPANRNMNSETNAIKIFKNIFKHNPLGAVDWDIVRAIAYSGAKR